MSGPYRFNQESAKSPLDRTTSPFSAGQPVSFKTNVNRAKTKKWVTAKKNAYDGDDWGDYDEYDEYGVDQDPPPQAPAQSQRYYAGGAPQRTYTDRSFTEPVQQGPPGKGRRNSFEAGEEHRAFSASIPPPQQGPGQQQYGEPEPQARRDFTPSAMPPPLQTQISPMPSDINASPARTQFPPRKSSIGQSDSPVVTSPRSRTGSHSDKPLPFVRPADIYKRVEEERERERASLDSSRPSLDSLSGRPKDDLHSPTSDGGRMLQPLETVAERKSEYLPNFDSAFTSDKPPTASNGPLQAPDSHIPAVTPPSDQGFRSVVDQAFTRVDDQNSIPPTPITKDSESDMSRTNTGSTYGISPIMSRVPSAATSAMKRNQAGEGSTPVITEEPSDAPATVPQETSYFPHDDPTHAAATKPVTDHTRNLSSTSLPRSGLATPTRGDSPARSPVIAPQKDLPQPEAAQVAEDSPERMQAMDGGLTGPSPAYASREADIATAAKTSAQAAGSGLGAAEKQSQDAFLDSHVAQSPIEDALPRSRSESPSKGRVQALAGKFGDVASSRRGSTQSNMSRNSVQSWEKSQDNSRAPSPTKGSPSKPSSPTKEFRPHLPGQWESYATSAATPMDQGDRNRSLDFGNDQATTSLENADLTPTTAKRPVDGVASDDNTTDPLAALKNAGAAMAQSFKATVGIDDGSPKAHSEEQHKKDMSHGDMYMPRPLQLERNASSISSIPPTPPAKDTPADEHPPHIPADDVNAGPSVHQKRPEYFAQLSTQPSADDEESDRLRKEIVASLTPVASTDPNRASLLPGSPGTNRASSILPAEYDSYWADGGEHTTARQSHDADRSIPATATAAAAIPTVAHTNELPKPSLLNRFSWEDSTPQLATSGNAASVTAVPEPTKSAPQETVPPPSVERAVEEERNQWSGQQEPYFGPAHTLTVTQPDPITDPEPPARSPTSPVDHSALASPTREHTRSPGLHVVNSAEDPEAVDLPPRLSAENSAPALPAQDDSRALPQEVGHEASNAGVTTAVPAPEPTSSGHVQGNNQEPSPASPTSGKPLGAREIATINSTAERIATYNSTRQHWATHDHGLEEWLTSAINANPELASQTLPYQRTSTGTVRHKHAASLSLLGKFGSASTYQLPGGEHNPSSTHANAAVESPTAGASPGSGAAFDRRVASRQLEAKGKDLLHTANVLSGKGLTSAKGLFAKGKSRFGREKGLHSRPDSMPSSREASEEPELMSSTPRNAFTTTTPEKTGTLDLAETDSARDGRKKRRFSLSSFHRSSRSRSRPSSIALPSNASFFSSTPKGTPPRELSRILGEEKSRPHSYHAPDSWNVPAAPRSVSANYPQSTPPREQQSRLGILPSPAKSAFSAQDKEDEQDIPPVPQIPDRMRLSNDLSHEVLQSVIRYSTPPLPAASLDRKLATSPVFRDATADEVSGKPEQKTAYMEQRPEPLHQHKLSHPEVAEAEDSINTDSSAHPEASAQWPLVDFQPGASVSTNDNAARAPLQPQSRVPRDIDGSLFDEDDQPPRLSYEPVPPSRRSDEAGSLPPYLVLTHLDVSDDEETVADGGLHKNGKGSLLAEPRIDNPSVSPLQIPTQSTAYGRPMPTQTQMSRDEIDSAPTPSASGATVAPDSAGPHVAHNEHLERVASTKKATSNAHLSILSTPYDSIMSPSGASNAVLDASKHEADTDGDGREQALSPAPVWFANNTLQVSKARTRDAGDAEDHVHVSDHDHEKGGYDEASPNLALPTGVRPAHGLAARSSSALQVVHAVEYAASDSSFASWDDSALADSVSGSSQPGDMRDESDLVTPVAQVPKIVHVQAAADQAEANTGTLAAPNGYFTGHEPQTMGRPQQQSTDLAVPERSKSMLSMISSMVSEGGTPISPTTSNAGRSTPSTIRRMQRESPGKNPVTSDRIPEESMVNYDDHTPTAKDDDFDLYADHNGIVKDVRDESGQPLRVDPPRRPEVRNGSQSTEISLPAPAPVLSEPSQEDRPRYSTERPMSFVSGPTDQDGRPQDQLNQPLQHSNGNSRPSAERLAGQEERPHHPAAPQANTGQRSDRAPDNRDLRQERPPARTHMLVPGQAPQNTEYHRAQAQPSMQSANAPANSFQPSLANGHSAQINQHAGQRGQDPPMFGPNPPYVESQRIVAEGRAMVLGQDPRHPNQLNGTDAGARNQYEYQQHMMQRQAQPPHAQAAVGHSPYGGMQEPKEQTFKQQEKSSSLPKFSSVFKGFGGKTHGSNQNQQAAQPANAALQPDQRLNFMDHNRMPSSHSAVSSLHRDQRSASGGDQVSLPAPSTRPPSNGAESHFSHVSQGSTHVQPAGSRVDLRKPASPMPFQGIPPKLVPASVGTGQAKGPEKKKRFSALGNIFARSNDANPSKTKLSKEEKKAQKAQRHSTAPPMQNPGSQWPQPQQQLFRPPQQSMPAHPSQYPPHHFAPQQMRPMGPQYASQQTMSPASLQSPQSMDPYGVPQRYQHAQPGIPTQPHAHGVAPEQASAYQSTRQLAEQQQAAQKAIGGAGHGNHLNMDIPRQSHIQRPLPPHQDSHGPPPGGYYNPNPTPSMAEKGAYNATQAARVLAEQQQRQMAQGRDVHPAPHDPRLQQHQQHSQPSVHEQEAYRLLQLERLRLEQQRLQLEAEQRSYTVTGAEQAQHLQRDPQHITYNATIEGRQQHHQQPMPTTRVEHQQPVQYRQQHDVARAASQDELLRAHQERQQLEQQRRSQQYAERVQPNQRSASGPLPPQNTQAQALPAQRHVSSPIARQPEPQYDTPQIPAAYSHVSGAFISPPDLRPQSQPSTPREPDMRQQQYERQYSDAQMSSLSPQVSAQSQTPQGHRTHSDASIVSVVSPLSAQAQDLPSVASPPAQRSQKPRMSSISEVHPGTPERPWHMNFPEGATEQEIVRARQRQFMQQQFSAQQQQHAERAAQSPSPRVSSHSQSPAPPQPVPTASPLQQGGGFKELLPRSSPQPYTQTDLARTSGSSDQARLVGSTQSAQLLANQPGREPSPASYPLPMSPEPRDVTSPVNPLADALSAPPPPPKSPHGNMRSTSPTQQSTSSTAQQHAAAIEEQYEPTPPQEDRFNAPTSGQASQFEQNLPDDPPPSYDGPGVPNDGMDKSRPDRVRPPNIETDVGADSRDRQGEPRARQPSIGILQHPQPASMAASPQRSSADMGAESLRRQLLQQEEYARMERIQRAQIQRAESERERKEREAARARARELERSVSGGTRVGSIRSVAGSRNGGQPGWERRGSTSRPVFELPAVEDDEPSMRATSYPGQEWVPHVWTDD